MLPAQIGLMNIVITLICHLEQNPADLTANEYKYLLDCVEHSRQDIPAKSNFNDSPQNKIFDKKDLHSILDLPNNSSFTDDIYHKLEPDKKLSAENSTTKRLNETSDSALKKIASPSVEIVDDASKRDINNIIRGSVKNSELLNNVAAKTNIRKAIVENDAVSDANAEESSQISNDENKAAYDDTQTKSTTETSFVETDNEIALNDGIPEDGMANDDESVPRTPDENNEPQLGDISISFTSTTPVVLETNASTRKEQAPMDEPKSDSQPPIASISSTRGSWSQASPNRQPLLAAQFAEKLESSSPNEVDYICVDATCDANNTMDPLARLILLQRLTSVDAVRIRNINLEPPYDVGFVDCELESYAFNASTGRLSSVDDSTFFACSVRTRWKQFEYDWKYLFSVLFIAAGGVGNILVCLAVCLDKSLQNVTNYFLLSLALADLLVSVVVMPLGAIPGFFGYWPLSVPWCNVYLSSDVLACSSSIMHMCCISLGRYLGIRNPLKTRHTYSTKKLVGIKIAIVWCLSLSVGGSITLLGLYNRSNIMQAGRRCAINNRAFFLFGSLVAFYVPMLIMVISYALTVRLLRHKARFLDSAELNSAPLAPTFRTLGGKNNKPRVNQPTHFKVDQQTQTPQVIDKFRFPPILVNFRLFSHIKAAKQRRRQRRLGPTAINSVRTEQKASKVLGLVFFTFVLCWAPFFLLQILQALCPQGYCSIPEDLAILCLWLGYFSSILNPIIYTIFNRTFRAAFIRLLKCQCGQVTKPIRYRSVNDRTASSGPTSVPLTLATGVATAAGRSLSVSAQAQELNPNYPSSTSSKI